MHIILLYTCIQNDQDIVNTVGIVNWIYNFLVIIIIIHYVRSYHEGIDRNINFFIDSISYDLIRVLSLVTYFVWN